MNKFLATILIYCLTITSVMAGLPPTTLSGEAQATKPTTFSFKTPNNQATQVSGINSRIETGNSNLLANPSYEHSTFNTSWTTALGTASLTTNALNAGSVVDGLQAFKVVSAGAGVRVAQVSTINAAGIKGQQMVARVKVSSTDSALQVCALVDNLSTGDTNCITAPVTSTDSPFKLVEIPFIAGGTSNGIVIKSATTGAQTIYIDDAFVGAMAPFQTNNAAQLVGTLTTVGCAAAWTVTNTAFTAPAAQTGCTYTATGQATAPATMVPAFTFASLPAGDYRIEYEGYWGSGTSGAQTVCAQFTDGTNVARESSCAVAGGGAATMQIPNISQTISYTSTQTNVTLSVKLKSSTANALLSGTTANPGVFKLWYFPTASLTYSQASANYPFINLGATTVTSVGGGAVKGTVVVDRFWARRDGQMLEGIYQYQQSSTGTAGSGQYIFSLPTGYAFDTSIIVPYSGTSLTSSNTAVALASVGTGTMAGSSTGQNITNCRLIAYSSTQYRVFCVGASGDAAATQWQISGTQMGFGESATMSYTFNIRAPISGWSNSSNITASFAGVPAVPGVSGSVDTLVFFFAANSSLNSVCTTPGACYLDQFGTGVTSVTRTASTGIYTIVFARTYSKIACQFQGYNGTQAPDAPGTLFRATSTNTITLNSTLTGSNVSGDTLGTVICWGAY